MVIRAVWYGDEGRWFGVGQFGLVMRALCFSGFVKRAVGLMFRGVWFGGEGHLFWWFGDKGSLLWWFGVEDSFV